MRVPLQVSLHGIDKSDALHDAIHARAEKLERYCDRITSCRVAVEFDARHKRQGKSLRVRIDVRVPGKEMAVTREHDADVMVAVRDAFRAARRMLEDHARERRGDVKLHSRPSASPPRGS
jgi:ribosomal subunit interface protein